MRKQVGLYNLISSGLKTKGMLKSGYSANFSLNLRDNWLIIKVLRIIYVFLLLLFGILPYHGSAQIFKLPAGQKIEKVRFELINNLVIIPLEINGAELTFILDSGVGKPILFNLHDQDSLQLNNVAEITINGLGEGEPINALSSHGNSFRVKGIQNNNQEVYVVIDKEMNFSPVLGIPVHGIIGYDLFKDFVVDINYNAKVIKFIDPAHYTPKKGSKYETIPLWLHGNKAYVKGEVQFEDNPNVPVKLLVDTGSSDAVWLFEDDEKGLGIPDNNYEDYLGKGLNGQIFGRRTKVNRLKIGSFILSNAKAAFPNMESFGDVHVLGDRNGSVGGEVLRRFNIVFNYPGREVTLRKNSNFKLPFQYNLSGLELQHNGMRYIAERIANANGVVRKESNSFGTVQILMQNTTRLSLVPEIVVSGIRAGSPAAQAGLREGDVVLAVNGKSIHSYKLQEVLKMINKKEGKRVKLLIERLNNDLLFSFVLRDVFE
ncbi:aspartyl protease family protein [Flavobacteriaceae bacterium D16]|nr:aspartyl protease family protein [Flavobacteriaceae bacterium D16]